MEQVEVAAPSAAVQWTAQGPARWWTPQTPSNPSFLAERRRRSCQREEELQGGARRRSSGRRARARVLAVAGGRREATGPDRRRAARRRRGAWESVAALATRAPASQVQAPANGNKTETREG